MKPKIILITNPEAIIDEPKVINRLFEEGLQLLHLRKPEWNNAAIDDLLTSVKQQYHERIVLPYSLYEGNPSQYRFSKKLHFFEQQRMEMPINKFETLQQQGFTLSTSVHDILEYKNLPKAFAYAFFSPVFNSISKPGYKAMNITKLDVANLKTSIALIALGGIDEGNCLQALGYDFDGVALLGAVWQSNNPVEKFIKIQQCITGQ